MPIRILLADDHPLIRHGVRRLLGEGPDYCVIAEALSGLEAVELAAQHQPDVALVDIGMKGLNGIDATTQIMKRSPRTGVVILSMFSDERHVTQAVKAGAKGYVVKDSVEDDLLQAVSAVHSGQSFFSPAIARILLECFARNINEQQGGDRYDLLTERERQVYHILAEGRSNKEVATLLKLSLHTVETHRIRIMQKLGVHNIAELILSAVRRGLVS